jgi:hypothetical protein
LGINGQSAAAYLASAQARHEPHGAVIIDTAETSVTELPVVRLIPEFPADPIDRLVAMLPSVSTVLIGTSVGKLRIVPVVAEVPADPISRFVAVLPRIPAVPSHC